MHKCRGCYLGQEATCWQRFRPVKHADVIQTQESTRENILAFDVLTIDPPVAKIQPS